MDRVEVDGKMVKRSRVGYLLQKVSDNLYQSSDGVMYRRLGDGSLRREGKVKRNKAEKKRLKKERRENGR